MESPLQRCARIVAALEDLAEQEAMALAASDFAAVLALQARTEPLVNFIADSGRLLGREPALKRRVAAIRDQRDRTATLLASRLDQARTDLTQVKAKQGRVARIRPVYGHAELAPKSVPHFQAVG